VSSAVATLVALVAFAGRVRADAVPALEWPRFRGPSGCGVAAENARPPSRFSASESVGWQVPVPPGNASPIVFGRTVVVTGFSESRCQVIALDRASGRERWRREFPVTAVEEVHRSLGSPASATPVTDGRRIVVHFGSIGLVALGIDGQELWRLPLPMPQTEYGSSSSPVLHGDRVYQLLDQDGPSSLVAVDVATGRRVWTVDRPEMRRGFGTPVIWEHHDRVDLVVPGTFWLIGYHPQTGEERWRVSGLARITCTSPVIGDGMLLTSSWTTGGDRSSDRITMPPFDEVLAAQDRDRDGALTFDELPEGAAKQRFKHLDGNRNQKVERSEWESMAAIFSKVENQSFGVVPDAQGKVSDAGVRWRYKKGLPYVASPVLYRGRFYQVKNGGLMTCLDPKTGVSLYQEERLDAPGDYYASLLAADGKIYATSQRGVVTVIRAGDALEVLARNDLGEPVHASPVAVGGQLLVRTATRLYSFEQRASVDR
jgi:outer membrane protein assembly factor BamB